MDTKHLKQLATRTFVLSLVLAVSPAAAHGDYLKGLRFHDAGSRIHYGVTVCTTHRTRVEQFNVTIQPDTNGIAHKILSKGGVTGPGCDRWTGSFKDIYLADIWEGWMAVALSNGRVLHSPVVEFAIN